MGQTWQGWGLGSAEQRVQVKFSNQLSPTLTLQGEAAAFSPEKVKTTPGQSLAYGFQSPRGHVIPLLLIPGVNLSSLSPQGGNLGG